MSNYFYKNLYEILGIEPTDDTTKIKSAYRKLARKYHPDANAGNELFVTKFKEITEAYEILTDKDKKLLYDSFKGYNKPKARTTAKEAQKAYKSTQNKKTSQTATPQQNEPNFSDVFNNILEGLFKEKKQQTTQKKQPKNGSDITTEVTISYIEALNGTNRTINILHTEICPNCQGKMFINGAKCPLCGGSGEKALHKKINVKIPQNIKQNAKIRIANEGNRGKNGGKNGDVYLIVKIENDSKYTYDGLNVSFDECIFPHEAVFGTDLHVITPQGSVSMKVPANTSQGQKFRLSAHGLKDNNGKIGDAIVTIRIDLPKELSDDELELYKKLSELSKTKTR